MEAEDDAEMQSLTIGQRRFSRRRTLDHLTYHRKIYHGYVSLFLFLLWVALYFGVLSMQKNNTSVHEENDVLKSILVSSKGINKGACTFQTVEKFWTWFETNLFPAVMSVHWEKSISGVRKSGYQSRKYNDVVGGVRITTERRQPEACGSSTLFLARYSADSNKCLHDSKIMSDEPLRLPNMNRTIEYDAENNGYTIMLSTHSNSAQLKKQIANYKNSRFVNYQTSQIQVEYGFFNNNQNVLGHTNIDIKRSLSGYFSCKAYVETLPVQLYESKVQMFRTILEIVVLLGWLLSLFKFIQALWTHNADEHKSWRRIPCDADTGEPYVLWNSVFHILFFTNIILWILLNYNYNELEKVLNQEIHSQMNHTEISAQASNLMESSHQEAIHSLFRWYFGVAAVSAFCLMQRGLEFVDFQPKLNSTTATFRGLFADIAGFGLVFTAVVTCFGFMGFLIFGAQVSDYSSFWKSFVKTWQMSFGVYKLKDQDLLYVSQPLADAFVFAYRLVVIVLLLKMVMAIIFESYKSVKKSAENAIGFGEDMTILNWHFCDWMRSSCSSILPRALFEQDAASSCCVGYDNDAYVPPNIVRKLLAHGDFDEGEDSIGVSDILTQLQVVDDDRQYVAKHAEWIVTKYESIPANFTGLKDKKDKDKGDKDKKDKDKGDKEGDKDKDKDKGDKDKKDKDGDADEPRETDGEIMLLRGEVSELKTMLAQILQAQSLTAMPGKDVESKEADEDALKVLGAGEDVDK